MFAFMNREALAQDGLASGTRDVSVLSRSRRPLWVKGETSGHEQQECTEILPLTATTMSCCCSR
jgi:phosphoribosyl-AMP cyclohydrolase